MLTYSTLLFGYSAGLFGCTSTVGSRLRVAVAVAHDHRTGFAVSHVQAVGGTIDQQLAQVARVGGLAVLAGPILHQLHDADGLFLRGVEHGHRQIHSAAHLQAVVGSGPSQCAGLYAATH